MYKEQSNIDNHHEYYLEFEFMGESRYKLWCEGDKKYIGEIDCVIYNLQNELCLTEEHLISLAEEYNQTDQNILVNYSRHNYMVTKRFTDQLEYDYGVNFFEIITFEGENWFEGEVVLLLRRK